MFVIKIYKGISFQLLLYFQLNILAICINKWVSCHSWLQILRTTKFVFFFFFNHLISSTDRRPLSSDSMFSCLVIIDNNYFPATFLYWLSVHKMQISKYYRGKVYKIKIFYIDKLFFYIPLRVLVKYFTSTCKKLDNLLHWRILFLYYMMNHTKHSVCIFLCKI